MLLVPGIRQGSQKSSVAGRTTDVVRRAGILSCCANRQAGKSPARGVDVSFDDQAMPPAVTHVVGVFELSRGRRLRHDRLAGVNYFFRRIAAPDWLLMGGRCLTVIVTGSNKCGGRDGNETQWIGTSGAHCGGSRSVFDERAFCEADDFARVCRDHGLSPKVGAPDLERRWLRQQIHNGTTAASTLR